MPKCPEGTRAHDSAPTYIGELTSDASSYASNRIWRRTSRSLILVIRRQRVLLDEDLARLYGVETRAVLQAVKRNPGRFPSDFMFELSAAEWAALRSQSVTSESGRGGRRYAPFAFTEQGVAMLSSVLNSDRAIAVNIEIMRSFVRIRGCPALV